MKQTPAPRTLVISWHWPPANRASTGVIANLFRCADNRYFSAITRNMPSPADADRTDAPPIPTTRVPWLLADDNERTGWTWLASILACIRIVRAGLGRHRDIPFRKILGVYPHRYSVLAAWAVSRLTGAKLVLWMHDLFSETLITRNRFKRRFWRWVDQIALAHAALVIVPTREFADHYDRRGACATWVLPHCRNPRIKPSALVNRTGPLRLLYSGSTYQAHIDALRLLVDVTDTRPDIELDLHTNPVPGIARDRTRWLRRSESLDRLPDADVLIVVLGRDTPYPEEVQGCFPSKIVDYLAVGRPILAIVPPGSFVERLITESGCGVAVTRYETADILAALDRLKDAATREEMGHRALAAGFQLEPSRWMDALCRRLAGAADEPEHPRFPAPMANAPSESVRESSSRAVTA